MSENDLGINEDTSMLLLSFDAKAPSNPDGKKWTPCIVRYKVSARDGATPEMIDETIYHFKAAVWTLVNGHYVASDNIPARSNWVEKLTHGEARVNIYSFGGFPIPIGDKVVQYDINIFNEFSAVGIAVAHAWMFVMTIVEGEHAEDLITNSNGSKTTKNQPKAQKPAPAPAQDTSTAPPVPGDSIVDLDYDYKLRGQYEQDYIGRTVRVHVKKIQWCVETKKDKSGSYEMIQLFKESHYENPIYDLSIWPPKPDDKYSDGKMLLKALPAGALTVPGDWIEGDIAISYRLKTSDKHPGRVFWNIVNVEADIVDWSHNDHEAEPVYEDEGWERDANDPDKIPF